MGAEVYSISRLNRRRMGMKQSTRSVSGPFEDLISTLGLQPKSPQQCEQLEVDTPEASFSTQMETTIGHSRGELTVSLVFCGFFILLFYVAFRLFATAKQPPGYQKTLDSESNLTLSCGVFYNTNFK